MTSKLIARIFRGRARTDLITHQDSIVAIAMAFAFAPRDFRPVAKHRTGVVRAFEPRKSCREEEECDCEDGG